MQQILISFTSDRLLHMYAAKAIKSQLQCQVVQANIHD